MPYARKTRDEWSVQGDYGQGWEDVCTEDTRREAVARRKEYDANEPQYPHRLKLRRVPLEERGTDPRGPMPLEMLRHHVSGAIERGQAEPITEQR